MQGFWLAAVAAIFFAGLAGLIHLRVAQGDVFPAYSTLRADPLGTRALYEALTEVPSLEVERSVLPLKKLGAQAQATIVLAGMDRRGWHTMSVEEANLLEASVRGGARLVVLFRAEMERLTDGRRPVGEKDESTKKEDDADKTHSEREQRRSPRNDEAGAGKRAHHADWERRLGLELHTRWIVDGGDGAWKRHDAPHALEDRIAWKSDLFFHVQPGAEWRVIYTRGGSAVLLETSLGAGTVVMASDSYFVSNEAMQKTRTPRLLAWIMGGHSRVIFSEAHLGVVENEGVARLARRYGLTGMFFVLVLLAALFVWKRMALFVPPPPEHVEAALGYHPAAGLEALLRRVLSADKLIDTCVAEWEGGGRLSEVDRNRVREVIGATAGKTPAEKYNAIVRALKRR
jgi:hypothetical protein